MSVTVAILGTSGYSGQETLDRVLRQPALEVVARGSDSLAGSPAGALDPRLNGSLPAFVTNDAAAAAGAALAAGLVVGTAGDTVLRLTPPLTITADEVAAGLFLLEEVLT